MRGPNGAFARAVRPATDAEHVDSRYREAADLLDGYVHESRFLRNDLSPDHRIVWASDGFAAVYGCTVDQYNRGEIWGGLYHPEERASALERAAALRRGETVEAELRICRAPGETRWLYVKNQPLVDPSTGVVTGVLGVGQDITKRKMAEQAQRTAESILKTIAHNDPGCMMILDADLNVRFVNRPLQIGRSSVDIGRSLPAILGAENRGLIEEALKSVLAGGATISQEIRIDGSPNPAEYLEIRALPLSENSFISALAVRITDISARKRDEEALRTHAIILETMHEGVILFDLAGMVRHSNSAARRMFGSDADGLLRANVADLGIQYRFGADRGAAPERRSSGSTSEAVCCRADGTRFIAKVAFTQLTLREQIVAIAVLRDVTEQKQLEREIIDIANREQQRIAVDLHDGLGQELTGAALMLRSLAEKNLRDYPAVADSLEEVMVLVNRAINEARTLARGLSPVELEHGGLSVALNSLVARTREAGGIAVRFHARLDEMPVLAPSVANHLYRIAQEALSNATRHSGAKSIRLSLFGRHDRLELSITDDGCGIGGARAASEGMGLRIMDYRARMIDAEISVRGRAHGGTRVVCRLKQGAS